MEFYRFSFTVQRRANKRKGAITMLIAVAVFYVARRNRKRQEQANRYIEDVPFESSSKCVYDYGRKPRMSADTMHGIPPFLTDSERNIVRRAATQDGQPEVSSRAEFEFQQ